MREGILFRVDNTFLVNSVMVYLSNHDSEVNHGGQKKNDQKKSGEEKNRKT